MPFRERLRVMRKVLVSLILVLTVGGALLSTLGASADPGTLRVGIGTKTITPYGPSPEGWNFWMNPITGIWSEEFTDRNNNGYYDPGTDLFTDDPRNTLIDPQSAGKFDGCWTNAGFSGRGPLGVYDDTWARALVLEAGGKKVAVVSLDAVGFFYEEIERARVELEAAHPEVGLDMLIVSSTHTHEACDTMGYWGNPPIASDGKFPLYQQYIRSQIVEAVAAGHAALEPAKMKAATTTHTAGIRDSRPPQVIDPNLQAAQFVRGNGSAIGTIVNWSNHPEALGSGNRYISSDFPHGARERIATAGGGAGIYFSGSVGGLMTPLSVDMGTDPVTGEIYGKSTTKNRAYYIGRLVADSALSALANAPLEEVTDLDIRSKEIYMQGDNYALRALNIAGIFDKPTYQAGLPAGRLGEEFKTQIVTVSLGSVRMQTVPGELFPELEIGGYGRPDCEAADTGRPYEPVIRDQFSEQHLFTLGLAQDELGYIVPGYDFWMFGLPNDEGTPRPLIDVGGLEKDDPCGEGHYEETVSASSVMAPVVTCTIAELAGKDPWNDLDSYPACSEENTTVGPQGTHTHPN